MATRRTASPYQMTNPYQQSAPPRPTGLGGTSAPASTGQLGTSSSPTTGLSVARSGGGPYPNAHDLGPIQQPSSGTGPLYNNLDNMYGDIIKAYQQLLDLQKQQPLPADLSGLSGAMGGAYGAAGAQMQALYNLLGGQAGQMTDVLAGINEQMRALLDPSIGAAQRQQMLDLLRPQRRQSQSIYLFGY